MVAMSIFVTMGPNSVRAPSGAVVTVLGRVGVRYATSEETIEIDSEMLAREMTIAVYPGSIVSPFTSPSEVLAETVGALRRLGFTVEQIGSLP